MCGGNVAGIIAVVTDSRGLCESSRRCSEAHLRRVADVPYWPNVRWLGSQRSQIQILVIILEPDGSIVDDVTWGDYIIGSELKFSGGQAWSGAQTATRFCPRPLDRERRQGLVIPNWMRHQ